MFPTYPLRELRLVNEAKAFVLMDVRAASDGVSLESQLVATLH